MRVEGVNVRAPEAIRSSQTLWPCLAQSLQGRVIWTEAQEITGSVLSMPPLTRLKETLWLYLETDFGYAPHRQVCAEGGESRSLGTRYPMIMIFAEAKDAAEVAENASLLRTWLSVQHGRFERSRVLLLSYGSKPASRDSPHAALSLTAATMRHGLELVELHGLPQAAEYIFQCAAAVAESRKRRVPSRFKVAGLKCQTLRDPGDKLRISWVSQLMQIPGVSEDIAKVIAERYPSPGVLLDAVARADEAQRASSSSGLAEPPHGVCNATADAFLSEIEFPIRGKKSTRRIGPIVSRRVFTLFHASVAPELVLV